MLVQDLPSTSFVGSIVLVEAEFSKVGSAKIKLP